jgi:hypothetical protein
MPQGTRISLDKTLIGTIGADGSLSYPGIAPGRHTLQLVRPGHETVTLTREFAAAKPLVVSAADVAWKETPIDVEVLADAGTDITISLGGEAPHRLTGPGKLALAPGSYRVVAKGPSGFPLERTVPVSATDSRTIDLRALPSGMEGFDGAGWTRKEAWFTRRGGGFVTYARTGIARVGFTVRTDRSRNPFSTGPRLKWVVGYVDARNHLLIELSSEHLYRTQVVNGTRREMPRVAYKLAATNDLLNISVESSPTRVIHQYNAGSGWTVLDSWDIQPPAEGRFGFYLPGNETLDVSNFRYDPIPAP